MIELETPYYCIDEKKLNHNLFSMKEALNNNFKNWIIGYSFKTNSLPWILNYIKTNGCFAEVVSYDEYELAAIMGFDKNKIIYNGPMKSKKTFIHALENNCIVNIDTWREIEWLTELNPERSYKIGIRINFDIEKDCPGESACGNEGGRFGFCVENKQFYEAIKSLKLIKNIKVSGIHLHTSSKTRSLEIYKSIARNACKVIKEFDLDLDYIDVGGGFFGGVPTQPSFFDYFSEIKKIFSDSNISQDITVIVEPGASLIASPISFVTSVIDVKITNRNIFITTDGSRNDIDPLMSKSTYLYEIKTFNDKASTVDKQIISGFTCMEHDRLFELKDNPLLSVGDRIIYKKVGSYTMCLSPLFIKYFPSVYLQKVNGDICLIREK